MSAQPGPSKPPAASASSSTSASSSSVRPSTPGAFSTNTPRQGTPAGGQSAVQRGKQPAVPGGPVQAGAGGGGRVVQPGGGGAGAGQAQSGRAVNAGAASGPAVIRPTLNSILVNVRQKGNPVIGHIRTVPWEYGDIKCDYQVGATAGVLYLSIRYHLLHPEYIHTRIQDLGQNYNLRIILCQCDADNHTAAMKELTKVAIVNGYTLITCWSAQEAGRYLETYKSFERKPPDLIRERVDDSYMAHMTSALTSVRGVNKTDVTTLISNFGSFANLVLAEPAKLSTLPGLGDKKVRRLREAFTAPFTTSGGKNKRRRVEKGEAEKRGERGERENN
ncbi:DNA excision repair protein ERCC-1 [Rhodotorula toruloides]|nr:DNA excision repair protein ERCC-1 [Rhodotorula toruloides]